MKKYIWLIGGLLFAVTSVKGQTVTEATKQAVYTDQTRKTVTAKDQPQGQDRSAWAGYASTFVNLLGTDGKSSLELNATLFTLFHISRLAKNDTLFYGEEYRKQWFWRNTQLNLELTPDNKEQLQVDELGYGVKYAVLNNKTLTKNDIKDINKDFTNYLIQKVVPADQVSTKYEHDHAEAFKLVKAYKAANGSLPSSMLPPDFLAAMKAALSLKSDDEVAALLLPANYLKTKVKDALKNKPTLTFSANSSYDELKSQTSNLNAAGELLFYSSKQGTSQYDLKISYSHAADTTQKKSNLVRTIWDINFGPDLTFGTKWFELKPAVDYVNTQGPLYKKEYAQVLNAAVTPRFRINKSFWLPITFKYNAFQKDARLQGLFSVQYSLK